MNGGAALRAAIERAWWSPRVGLMAGLLWPLSLVYRGLLGMRALAYRAGLLRAHAAPVPVLVVGNFIVGGAGKTPTVMALVEALRADGWQPGVISRGHGSAALAPQAVTAESRAEACGDEPLLIHRRTRAPVWVGRDRVATARALCAVHPEVDLLISDDGLQHLALKRDAELVVFDARGTGNGLLLPAGPLREPLPHCLPPRSVLLYNAAAPSTPLPGALAQRSLGTLLPLPAWWAGDLGAAQAFDGLKGQRFIAAAGLADPERFFVMLDGLGLHFDRLPLADHAPMDPRPWPADDTRLVVVTEKDAVKLRPDAHDAARIRVATLDFQLPEQTLQALRSRLPRRNPKTAFR